MWFFSKKRGKKKRNRGGEKTTSRKKGGISYEQMCSINRKLLSKRRLIVYAESEM